MPSDLTVTGRYASRSSTARKRAWQNQAHPVVASIPNAKLEDVGQVEDGQDCSVGNVAQVFKKNGYTTGMVGKWHLTKNGAMTIEEIKAAVVGCGFDDVEAMYPGELAFVVLTVIALSQVIVSSIGSIAFLLMLQLIFINRQHRSGRRVGGGRQSQHGVCGIQGRRVYHRQPE